MRGQPFLRQGQPLQWPIPLQMSDDRSYDRVLALAEEKRCQLDRLYQRICDTLGALLREVGLKIAAWIRRKRKQISRRRPYNGN